MAIDKCLIILKSIEKPDLIAMHEFDDNFRLYMWKISSALHWYSQMYVWDLKLIQNQITGIELSFIFTGQVD